MTKSFNVSIDGGIRKAAFYWISDIEHWGQKRYPAIRTLYFRGLVDDADKGSATISFSGLHKYELRGQIHFREITLLDKICARWLSSRGLISPGGIPQRLLED